MEKGWWTARGDSNLVCIRLSSSTSWSEGPTAVISGDGSGKRGCLRSSNGETSELELAFDVDRCHENGRRVGGGMGGGVRPVLRRDPSDMWSLGGGAS